MFQKLVNHNDDLKRLLDKGYAITIDSNYIVVRDIPYLDEKLNLQIGAIVSKLVFVTNEKFEQENHQVYFAGSTPYGLNGKPIPNLGDSGHTMSLSEACSDVVVQRAFSNKPKPANKYLDHFHKIETYVGFISGPAESRYDVSPLTFGAISESSADSVFKFRDTLSSRAEINDISAKLENDVVAVVGLGGTGAYLLDLLVKSPVKEIRAFDHDRYHVHNAFRSPGRLAEEELNCSKAEVYQARYENFRENLHIENVYVDLSTIEKLKGVTFAFVAVDRGDARSEIIDLLAKLGIPFIDVGMGLHRKGGALSGLLRTTYFPADSIDAIRAKKWVPEIEDPENEYKTNIQISELNALNAALAVARYKQLRGFYIETDDNLNLLFSTESFALMRTSSDD